jgi:hypothetical protein
MRQDCQYDLVLAGAETGLPPRIKKRCLHPRKRPAQTLALRGPLALRTGITGEHRRTRWTAGFDSYGAL